MGAPVFHESCFTYYYSPNNNLKLDHNGLITLTADEPTLKERAALNKRVAYLAKLLQSNSKHPDAQKLRQEIHDGGYVSFNRLAKILTQKKDCFIAADNDSKLPQFLLNIVRLIKIIVAQVFCCKSRPEDACYFAKIDVKNLVAQMDIQGIALLPGDERFPGYPSVLPDF